MDSRHLAILALAALPLALPPSAAAIKFDHTRITYRDNSTYHSVVASAAQMWNAGGSRVRLVPTRKRSADIVIRTVPKLGFEKGVEVAGRGGIGYVRGRARGTVLLSARAMGSPARPVFRGRSWSSSLTSPAAGTPAAALRHHPVGQPRRELGSRRGHRAGA